MSDERPARVVLIDTTDPSLVEAVGLLSKGAGLEVRAAEEATSSVEALAAVLVDGVGRSDDAIARQVESWRVRAPVVARIEHAATAERLIDTGVRELALATEAPVMLAVRLRHVARRVGGASAHEPAIRKLIRHDLRSPLAVVLGMCELLGLGLRGHLEERQLEGIRDIERQAQRVMALIDRLAEELYGE